MKSTSFFFSLLLFVPLFSMASTYEISQKEENNKIKSNVHITIENSKINVGDYLNPSWSFEDYLPQCQSKNKSNISLRRFYIDDVEDIHDVIFVSYIMSCDNQRGRVKYVALYNGVPYILSGLTSVASLNDDFEKLSKSEFHYDANEELKKNEKLLNYMIRYWPSQVIVIK